MSLLQVSLPPVSPLSTSSPTVSYEDKLKENFVRGSAELEKRRLALEEEQRKERERREREEREAQERREREARELENRRRLEEERRMERQREAERQREEERMRELERKEVSRSCCEMSVSSLSPPVTISLRAFRQRSRRWSGRGGKSGSEGRKRSWEGGKRGSRRRSLDSGQRRRVLSWSWRRW